MHSKSTAQRVSLGFLYLLDKVLHSSDPPPSKSVAYNLMLLITKFFFRRKKGYYYNVLTRAKQLNRILSFLFVAKKDTVYKRMLDKHAA